jgi:hypothetical protein
VNRRRCSSSTTAVCHRTPALKAEQDANKLAEKGYRLVSFEDKSGPLRGGLGFATYEYVGKDEAKKKK